MTEKKYKTRVKLWTPAIYRIEVEGHLNESRSECLAGMHITVCKRSDQSAMTTLVGRLKDQAELSGVLNSLYDLHMSIRKVELVKED